MAEQTADQRDAGKLEDQAHGEHERGKHGAGMVKQTESKLAKHRDLIVVSISLLSLIIAFTQWNAHKAKKAAAAAASSSSTTDPNAVDPSAGGTYLPTTGAASSAGYVDGSGVATPGSSPDWTTTLTAILGQQQQTYSDAQAKAIAGQNAYLGNLTHELGVIDKHLTAKPPALQHPLPRKKATPVAHAPHRIKRKPKK